MGLQEMIDQENAPLRQLFSTSPNQRLAGYIYRMSYDNVLVLTNDHFRAQLRGIPQNCLLIACPFDPEKFDKVPEEDRSVVLLRVMGPGKLPQEGNYVDALIQHYQDKTEHGVTGERDGIDIYTYAQLQHGALECKILGSFYESDGALAFGSDVEDFTSATPLAVYKPTGDSLKDIVGYTDPARLAKSIEDVLEQGFVNPPAPFEIGNVRYTSTRRMQKSDGTEVPVSFESVDMLAKRTGVFGMTRTGKSNLIKTLISSCQLSVLNAGGRVGQLVLDLNGEYANANAQDKGAISDVFDGNVVRYRGVLTPGFFDMRPNFYQSYDIGFQALQAALKADGSLSGGDMKSLQEMTFGPEPADAGEKNRWQVKVAAYRSLLYMADFEMSSSDNYVKFNVGEKTASQAFIELELSAEFPEATTSAARAEKLFEKYGGNPKGGLTIENAFSLLVALRKAHIGLTKKDDAKIGLKSQSGKAWFDQSTLALLNLAVGENSSGTPIRGKSTVARFSREHSPTGSAEVDRDIYKYLKEGRIVIVDLSVGHPSVRNGMMERIAGGIFNRSFELFTSGNTPPPIMMYVEEAHNLIGKNSKPDETWPRIAKEAAKANIALVYATQEPSSVQPNILANSENILSSHLNNDDEVRTLSKYYDFADFADSIKRCQDVGFIRIKRLSAPFVMPVQVHKFDPQEVSKAYKAALPPGFVKAKAPEESDDSSKNQSQNQNFGLEF